MKLCIQCPINLLEKYAIFSDNIHVVYAEYIGYNRYTKFYHTRQKYYNDDIILFDRSFSLSYNQLIQKAKKVSATHIVAPSYPFEYYNKTINEVMNFISYLKQINQQHFKVCVIPQSNLDDIKGWIKSFKFFQNVDEIDMIMLYSKSVSAVFSFKTNDTEIEINRLYLTRFLKDKGEVFTKRIHYLGEGQRLHFISKYDYFCSIDVMSPVIDGIKGIKYDVNLGLPKDRILYNNILEEFDDVNEDIVLWNLMCVRKWSNGNCPTNYRF